MAPFSNLPTRPILSQLSIETHENGNHSLHVTLWSRPDQGEVSYHVKVIKSDQEARNPDPHRFVCDLSQFPSLGLDSCLFQDRDPGPDGLRGPSSLGESWNWLSLMGFTRPLRGHAGHRPCQGPTMTKPGPLLQEDPGFDIFKINNEVNSLGHHQTNNLGQRFFFLIPKFSS